MFIDKEEKHFRLKKKVCKICIYAKFYPNNNEFRYHKTTSYSNERLNISGPKIWNHCPLNIQLKTSLIKFEEYINTWFGPKCINVA